MLRRQHRLAQAPGERFGHRQQLIRPCPFGQRAELIGNKPVRLQRDIDHRRRHRRLPGAQDIKQTLGQMAGVGDTRQIHEAGATLDGVERAEDRVHQLKPARLLRQHQQVVFRLGHQFQRLGYKLVEHVVHQNPNSESRLSTSSCTMANAGRPGPESRSSGFSRGAAGA